LTAVGTREEVELPLGLIEYELLAFLIPLMWAHENDATCDRLRDEDRATSKAGHEPRFPELYDAFNIEAFDVPSGMT
jgi:hypothetical protein